MGALSNQMRDKARLVRLSGSETGTKVSPGRQGFVEVKYSWS
jgi:hypothetical protein